VFLMRAVAWEENMTLIFGSHNFLKTKYNERRFWECTEWQRFCVQPALPTPHINMNVVFYCRLQWTYNLCFHGSTRQSHVYMWLEDQAGRWPEEVASCLNSCIHTTCEDGGLQNIRWLIAWLHSCGGQSKNKYVMSFWYYIVHIKKVFESVEHKLTVPGHTYLVCDRDFGVLEWKAM
jgi:hypothetical protein